MTEKTTYVYGVGAAERFRTPLWAHGLPDGLTPVTVIAHGGVAAVVSYQPGPSVHSLSKPELLRQLSIHQRVIENAMESGDFLPARFGTVLASEDEVRSLLSSSGGLVSESLARFSGLVEVEVSATWDLEATIAEIAGQPDVVAAKAAAQQAPPADGLARRVELGQAIQGALDQRRALYQAMLLEEVRPLARDVQANALLTDQLVFNVALLLERRALADLDAAIERLDTVSAGRLSLRRIGPLPPYSFATINVRRLDAERLAAARAVLDLSGEISEQAVQSSYRRVVRRVHPDRSSADPTAPERFAVLVTARADLLAYCASRASANTADGEPGLIVMIERSGDDVSSQGGP